MSEWKKRVSVGQKYYFQQQESYAGEAWAQLVFISWCSVTANITNKPNQGRESKPALLAPNTAETLSQSACDLTIQSILQKHVKTEDLGKNQTSFSAA